MCTEAKGATAFELATVMLAVELEPRISKYGKLNGLCSQAYVMDKWDTFPFS